MTVGAVTIKTLDCQSFQTALHAGPKPSIRRGQFGRLWSVAAELMTEREDLELQGHAAPEGSENRS